MNKTHTDHRDIHTVVQTMTRVYELVSPFGAFTTLVSFCRKLNAVLQAMKSTPEVALIAGVINVAILFQFT